MKVLSGVYEKDEGEIQVFGQTVEDMTPKKAQELGIAIIHQELNLCRHLSVAENIFLGHETTRSGVLNDREMNEEAGRLLQRLNIDLTRRRSSAASASPSSRWSRSQRPFRWRRRS